MSEQARAVCCRRCRQPIPPERLEAVPSTEYCVACVDKHGPQVVHDPEVLVAKASVSCQNGFAPNN